MLDLQVLRKKEGLNTIVTPFSNSSSGGQRQLNLARSYSHELPSGSGSQLAACGDGSGEASSSSDPAAHISELQSAASAPADFQVLQ